MATRSRRRQREPGENGDCAGPKRGPAGGRPGCKKSRGAGAPWRIYWGALGTLLAASAALLLWGSPAGDGMEVLAAQQEVIAHRLLAVSCSQDYDNHPKFPGCTPQTCGRAVTDAVISQPEAQRLRRIAEAGFSLGGSDGGASILDLHSGALSMGKNFVNLYRSYGDRVKEMITEEDFQLYRDVRRRIQQEVARTFHLEEQNLHLTKPTFFSRMNGSDAVTPHDEYWHAHIDKVTYGSFDYTSLLYLSDFSRDFTGGRFIFIDHNANTTVEPRTGRLSFFTSGSENVHRVEKVTSGTRFAITISFTCNPQHAIADPTWT